MTGPGILMSFEIAQCEIDDSGEWASNYGAKHMDTTRRRVLQTTLGAGLLAMAPHSRATGQSQGQTISSEELLRVAELPVLQVSDLASAVTITEMELLRNRHNFVIRVRTKEGAEGLAVPNAMHLVHTYPIFLNRVAPFFVGKDAQRLEPLLWELYRHDDNYKYQGLALWVCVAAAEFAILDLLGKLTGKAIGDLLGRSETARHHRLSRQRHPGQHTEEEIAYLKQIVTESGAKASSSALAAG